MAELLTVDLAGQEVPPYLLRDPATLTTGTFAANDHVVETD
jgi:hypothetical protein